MLLEAFLQDFDAEMLLSSATQWLFNDSNFTLQLSGSDTFFLYHRCPCDSDCIKQRLRNPLSSFSHAPAISHLLTLVTDSDWPFVESGSHAFRVRDELPLTSILSNTFLIFFVSLCCQSLMAVQLRFRALFRKTASLTICGFVEI